MKADTDKCIACKRCFPYCPMGRIQTFHRHGTIPGRVYIQIDQDKCTNCGTCLEVCPPKFSAVKMLSGEPVPPPIPEEERTIKKESKAK